MKIGKEARIGISSILILLVAYWGITFLKGSNLLSRTNIYHTSYVNVDGLEMSSPILVNGMKVGTVIRVGMTDVKGEVVVDFTIKAKYQIPNNSLAVLGSQSVLGGKAITIQIGDSKEFYENGAIVKSTVAPDVMGAATDIAERASKLIDSLSLTISKVNSLISEKMIDDTQATMSNLNSSTESLSNILSTEKTKIASITTNLNKLSSDLNGVMPDVKSAISNLNNLTDTLGNSLPAIMAQIDEIVKKINDENGTVGKLLNDKQLYDSANITLEEASALLKDLKENPKRYVHFSLFGRKDKTK